MSSCLEHIKLIKENKSPLTKCRMIYFIQSGAGGPIKIGWTEYILQCMKELNTGNPNELHFLAFIPAPRIMEKELHNHFKPFKLKGEWFKPSGELLAFIAEIQETSIDKLNEILQIWKIQTPSAILTEKKSITNIVSKTIYHSNQLICDQTAYELIDPIEVANPWLPNVELNKRGFPMKTHKLKE